MNDDSKANADQPTAIPISTCIDESSGEPFAQSPNAEVAIADESSSRQIMIDGEMVRCGSPFAPGSVESMWSESGAAGQNAAGVFAASSSPTSIESLHDVGSIKYMALGALTAAVMVLFFDSVAAWWFPAGGLLIAGLGCGLSLFGMISKYRAAAVCLLIAHAVLLMISYQRVLA